MNPLRLLPFLALLALWAGGGAVAADKHCETATQIRQAALTAEAARTAAIYDAYLATPDMSGVESCMDGIMNAGMSLDLMLGLPSDPLGFLVDKACSMLTSEVNGMLSGLSRQVSVGGSGIGVSAGAGKGAGSVNFQVKDTSRQTANAMFDAITR